MSDAGTDLRVFTGQRFASWRLVGTFWSVLRSLARSANARRLRSDLDRTNGPALRDLARRGDLPDAVCDQIEAKEARSIALPAGIYCAISIPTNWYNRKDRT